MSSAAHDEQEAYVRAKGLLEALKRFYAEDRAAHEVSGNPEPFPEYLDWIKRERAGTLATMRVIQDGDDWRYTR